MLSVLLIGLSSLGCVVGTAAFAYFAFFAGNINAAAWGMISAVFAAATLHVHMLKLKRTLEEWYGPEELRDIIVLGQGACLVSLAAVVTYIFLAVDAKEGFTFQGTTFYPVVVFSVLSVIWSLLLFISTRSFRRRMVLYPALLNENWDS
ncbi:uncharacterized protein LOC118199169 [Stegodyphus dumicola]|uniref:uncharacterized protein LOC118199169 n=1 Tax=Stegodyphus dumicola TaxID=202533 RepID=UPI0015A803AF|nr:uncharacterized protein LOC118199169 [Stegodyphus dumicola]